MSRITTRSVLVTALLVLAGLGGLIVVQSLPDIRREIKIMMM
ncbi:MAG TPA: hypothetical protein VF510_11925 [Ktedonobacterales bacterium]